MTSDLRNLQTQQEVYFAENAKYAKTAKELGFQTSVGVNLQVTDATDNSWSAKVTHAALNAATQYCTVSVGGSGQNVGFAPVCTGN